MVVFASSSPDSIHPIEEEINEIIGFTTKVYRYEDDKIVTQREAGKVKVTEVLGYPSEVEVELKEKVNMVHIVVVTEIDAHKEAAVRALFERIKKEYPNKEEFNGGPSYIHIAGSLGIEQETALRLMALGKTLGYWEIINEDSAPFSWMRNARDVAKQAHAPYIAPNSVK